MLQIGNIRQFIPETTNGRAPTADGYGVDIAVGSSGSGYADYVLVANTGAVGANGLVVTVQDTGRAASTVQAAMDISIGLVGDGIRVVSDMPIGSRNPVQRENTGIYLPIQVPSNTDISVRIAWWHSGGTGTINANVDIIPLQDFQGQQLNYSYTMSDTYGKVGLDTQPRGTVVTSGVSAGTYGTPTLLGTTTRDYKAILLVPGVDTSTTRINYTQYAKLTLGSAGPQILNSVAVITSQVSVLGPFPAYPVRVNIPSGTELYVATASSTGNRTMDWTAHCFY